MNISYVILIVIILNAASLQSFSYGDYGQKKDTNGDKKKALAIARAHEHQRQAQLRAKQQREKERMEERKKSDALNK